MLTVISPAKSLDFETPPPAHTPTQPAFLKDAGQIVKLARKLKAADIRALMGVSDKIAALNVARFKAFSVPFTEQNARAAMFAFDGDVYTGLDAATLKSHDIAFAQAHLRILSGLYGLLRPLDLMQAYRLEMGLPFAVGKARSLQAFWADRVTAALRTELATHNMPVLINLASQEYFGAIRPKQLGCEIITLAFKQIKGGKAQTLSFFAKKARGQMARFMIEGRIDRPEGLRDFAVDGYRFDPGLSRAQDWVFARTA